MINRYEQSISLCLRLMTASLALVAFASCSALRPTATPPPTVYALDAAPGTRQVAASATAPTLIIAPPGAAAGFDSPRIVYLRETHKHEYFAHSVWVDPPAHMLKPLLASAIEHTGAFHAVLLTPSSATGDFRLDTEIIRLQHEFLVQPSRVRFTLRATLVEERTRRVLASREFDSVVPSTSEDSHGGVVAANRAVATALASLSAFCAEAVVGWGTEQ